VDQPERTSSIGSLRWVRYPADAARAVLALAVWALVAGWAYAQPVSVRGVVGRFVALVGTLPDGLTRPLVGTLQVGALLAPLAVLFLARRGRWRELGTALAAAGTTALLGAATNAALDDAVPAAILEESQRPSWVTGSAFPSGTYLAAVAAAVTVVAPSLGRGWRRLLWGSVAFVGAVRVLTAVETPVGIVGLVAAGVFVGSIAMFVLKVPLRSPAPDVISRALAAAGLRVGSVVAAADEPRHGPTYLASSADGTDRWFVKVVGRDERNGELLSRAVRSLRVDGPDDRRTVGAAETIAAEGLALVLADRAGARVPALVAVGATERSAAVLVMEQVDGTPLDELDHVDDHLLHQSFGHLARLHDARLAHGWASLHHLLRTDADEVVLVDLRWATPSAGDDLLATDLAELLASAAAAVGVERAVAAAARAFSSEQLGAALPFVQPLVLSPETRALVRRDKPLLGTLREAVQVAAGVDAYEMAKVERLSLRSLVTLAGTLVMGWVLLSLIGNAAEIWDALRGIDPAYLPVLLVVSLLGFPAGALSLMGAVNVRLPFLRTTEVMFAQSFLNRFTPANAGGMALRTRYLQRNGVTLVTAASAVAITSAASGVMQVAMAITFFTWVGRGEEATSFNVPSGEVIALVVVAVGVVLGVAYATTLGRRLLLQVWDSLKGAMADIRELARQPSKLVLLFGGAGLSKFVAILALAQTMRAFGVPVGLAAVGAMYITATTVASAAPTPGGVGAIEAALTAGLVGLGVEVGIAAAVVLVFRLFTYWLPTIPSWFFLTRIQARGDA
jgi:glycosyltransferase 2 family protein